jgi:hypothetical protein
MLEGEQPVSKKDAQKIKSVNCFMIHEDFKNATNYSIAAAVLLTIVTLPYDYHQLTVFKIS